MEAKMIRSPVDAEDFTSSSVQNVCTRFRAYSLLPRQLYFLYLPVTSSNVAIILAINPP